MNDAKPLACPTVHLNGSHGPTLLETLSTAYSAIGDAVRALQATGPNGRDYYPQGADAIRTAQAQHVARLAALAGVERDLLTIALNVRGQLDEREARK